MNIDKLFAKLPESKSRNITNINGHLVYDSGAVIYQALVGNDGELIPLDIATRNMLKQLDT